jgi:hypothetical protein
LTKERHDDRDHHGRHGQPQQRKRVIRIVQVGFSVAIVVAIFAYATLRSWGFSLSAITLSTLVTGIWNAFLKLALPIAAAAFLVATSRDQSHDQLGSRAPGRDTVAASIGDPA